MRISDWSSDVCSSDLAKLERGAKRAPLNQGSGTSMRGVSYVPIDACRHRSSRSRVPGLRAGHSFMWSRPLPDGRSQNCLGTPIFLANYAEVRNSGSSCFRRPTPTTGRAFAERCRSRSFYLLTRFVLWPDLLLDVWKRT